MVLVEGRKIVNRNEIVLPTYKLIADLMMSDGMYNFLIICRTLQQIETIYSWYYNYFKENQADKDSTYKASKLGGYIRYKNNVLQIRTFSNGDALRGCKPHLIIADLTVNVPEVRAISDCGFPPLIRDMDWDVAILEQDLMLK